MRNGQPRVRIDWGGETVVVRDAAACALVEHVAELEQSAADGGSREAAGEYSGPGQPISGPQAHLASVAICLKRLHSFLDRHCVPILTEDDN